MKSLTKPSLLLAVSLGLASGCASAHKARPVVPTVEITGTTNAPVTGYYILKGKRLELMGNTPLTIRETGLSQLAVRKVNSEQVLNVTARSPGGSGSLQIPANLDEGIRVTLTDLSFSRIPPQETLEPWAGTQVVLRPYWNDDTWEFDDPIHGLEREPFVKGAPDMLTRLVKDIPDAQSGFRLICSTQPFKGYQEKLVWVRAESGGNYYRLEDKYKKPEQGWLCPAMYRYFSETPKVLYLKAESKRS